MFEVIRSQVVDTVALMSTFLKEDRRIVCEGSNSVMSDIDFGTYPFVTSSNTTPGSASIGLGIPPTKISKIFGVCKAYTTRAQHWFPSVLNSDIAERIREAGNEYGTSEGKPRLVGWLDLVQVKYAAGISGFDSLSITKLDALTGLDRIGLVTAYKGINVDEDGYPATEDAFSVLSQLLSTWKDGRIL
jgi:adenylosuccinate synthase